MLALVLALQEFYDPSVFFIYDNWYHKLQFDLESVEYKPLLNQISSLCLFTFPGKSYPTIWGGEPVSAKLHIRGTLKSSRGTGSGLHPHTRYCTGVLRESRAGKRPRNNRKPGETSMKWNRTACCNTFERNEVLIFRLPDVDLRRWWCAWEWFQNSSSELWFVCNVISVHFIITD